MMTAGTVISRCEVLVAVVWVVGDVRVMWWICLTSLQELTVDFAAFC